MSDITNPNLEPIEESDLKLKEKFIGGGLETPKKAESNAGNKIEEKNMITPEGIEAALEKMGKKEVMKEGAVERESAYSKILSKAGTQTQTITSDDDVKSDAQTANAETDAESKITNLVNLAQTKGIPHAVKVARHMEDNYTLDEFHDRMLAEELHKALAEKGMIKEI